MAKRTLTLDIGAANVALAEYEDLGKGALRLVNYGIAPLDAPLDSGNAETILAPALAQLVRESGIRPGAVYVSLAGQMVFPKFSAIPLAHGSEHFEKMVRSEVEQNIPFPIDEMVYDSHVLGETESGDKSVMIVAAKLDQVESITDALSSSGFSPELVDVAPIALVNAVSAGIERAAGPDDGCKVILDIGAKTTSLIISEGEKLYLRAIPIAGNNFTREIAQTLGCTQEEAEAIKRERAYVAQGGVTEDADETTDRISKVCRAVATRLHAEISRSINFYRSQQSGSAPERLFLTGGTALLPQLDQFLAESLQIEVCYFNPFEFVQVGGSVNGESLAQDGMQIGPTVGLALRGAKAARIAINLIPPAILKARAEKRKIPLVAAAGVMLIAASVLFWLGAANARECLETKIEGVRATVSELQDFDTRIANMEKQVAAEQAKADAIAKLLRSRGAAARNLAAVAASLSGDDMWIDRWQNEKGVELVTIRSWSKPGGGTVSENVINKLRGSSAVVARAEADKQKLAGNPDRKSVRLHAMNTLGKTSSVEEFTMEVDFK